MKKLVSACIIISFFSCSVQKETARAQWIQLFNGKDLKDWNIKITGHPLNSNFAGTFSVKDGKLSVNYDHYDGWKEQYGHIFYKQNFSAYLLAVEYRFIKQQVKGGPGWAFRNSGVMLHAQSPATMMLDQDFPISMEAQLLGGDGKDERTTANLCTPGTNAVVNGKLYTDHCINSNSKTYHGDVWVQAEMLVLGDSVIKHMVEGDTVLAYEKPQVGGGHVGNYDPAVKKDGQLLKEGYIALQSESHPVEYRKVELFNLEKYMGDPEKLNAVLQQLHNRKQTDTKQDEENQ